MRSCLSLQGQNNTTCSYVAFILLFCLSAMNTTELDDIKFNGIFWVLYDRYGGEKWDIFLLNHYYYMIVRNQILLPNNSEESLSKWIRIILDSMSRRRFAIAGMIGSTEFLLKCDSPNWFNINRLLGTQKLI